jgi:hypothetical protein
MGYLVSNEMKTVNKYGDSHGNFKVQSQYSSAAILGSYNINIVRIAIL